MDPERELVSAATDSARESMTGWPTDVTSDDGHAPCSDRSTGSEGSVAERSMSEAEQRYVEAVAEDCRRILGPGMELVDLEIEEASRTTRMTVTYRLDGWEGVSSATSESVVGAHAALREALVIDRLRLGFSAATDPRALDPAG
jgi:hypothetical protein